MSAAAAGDAQASLILLTALIAKLVDKGVITNEEALGICSHAEQIKNDEFRAFHSRADMTRAIEAVKRRLV